MLPADYFFDRVLDLAERGAISGYADGTFKPYNYTTRSIADRLDHCAAG